MGAGAKTAVPPNTPQGPLSSQPQEVSGRPCCPLDLKKQTLQEQILLVHRLILLATCSLQQAATACPPSASCPGPGLPGDSAGPDPEARRWCPWQPQLGNWPWRMEEKREKGGRTKVENTLDYRYRSLASVVCLPGQVSHSVKVNVILRPLWPLDAVSGLSGDMESLWWCGAIQTCVC